jgi:hypothetical protein
MPLQKMPYDHALIIGLLADGNIRDKAYLFFAFKTRILPVDYDRRREDAKVKSTNRDAHFVRQYIFLMHALKKTGVIKLDWHGKTGRERIGHNYDIWLTPKGLAKVKQYGIKAIAPKRNGVKPPAEVIKQALSQYKKPTEKVQDLKIHVPVAGVKLSEKDVKEAVAQSVKRTKKSHITRLPQAKANQLRLDYLQNPAVNTYAKLAAKYKMSYSTIAKIIRQEIWPIEAYPPIPSAL